MPDDDKAFFADSQFFVDLSEGEATGAIDVEREYDLELRVLVKGFGRQENRDAQEQAVARILHGGLGSSVEVYVVESDGAAIPYLTERRVEYTP